MVAGAIAGNISAEATTPTGNSSAEAMRGAKNIVRSKRPIPTPTSYSGSPRAAEPKRAMTLTALVWRSR